MPWKEQKSDFVHLHNHSEYSLLDGASRIDDMINLAREFGMPALALTDHGNMFGAIKFYKAAKQAKIKPIIGAEVYIAPGNRQEKEVRTDIPEASFHLTLLCQNETGYYNLIKLLSLGYLEGFYYKPRIDKEILAKYSQGLIALSGCLKGEVNWFLTRGNPDAAMHAAAQYQEILGRENFYLEVMRNGLAEQEKIIPAILELAETLAIPVVATNDCHYLRPEDSRAQDVLLCIQTGKRLKDKDRLRLTGGTFHFRSGEEMLQLFSELPEAVQRTREIAERCDLVLDIEHRRFHLPAFTPPPDFRDEFSYLTHLARTGMKKRYPHPTPEIEQRLNHELTVIQRMGFAGYFLIVQDIINWAKQQNIMVGPGRGSAAGSLVLYCLGVTDIDPLKYGLLFERFLSTERITLPDVDVDFADARRQEVIDYIRNRYGKDSVAQIITFGTMQSRAVIRDVGRVLDIPITEVDRIAKMIPPGKELAEALKETIELNLLIRSRSEYAELFAIAQKLEGLCRHASVHASAVVITPRPLMELVPLYKVPEGETCTQYDMYSLEDIGLLKMDILGLRTLTVIDEAIKLVRENKPDFSLLQIDFSDRRTYQLLQKGETVGVFQLESTGMRDLCKRSVPEKLEHIIALIALYRPGPMDLIPTYLARKNGTAPVEYDHPLLEPFCRETYGILIYQEQVMQAAQVLAGYTLGQADILRRAMGKKKPEEMAAQRQAFITGCGQNTGIAPEKAARIFDTLEKFAGYGFNKSHAAGYAYLSYITAYLKANYPQEFIAASLTSELGDSDKLAKFIREAQRMDIPVRGPDINRSAARFTIEDNGVRFGLAGIKNIGVAAAEAVVAEREQNGPYQNLLDFLVRNRGKVNRKAVESLIKAGAFDSCDQPRDQLLTQLDLAMTKAASEKLLFAERQFALFGEEQPSRPSSENTPGPPENNTLFCLACEKEAFGFYFSSHPLERYRAEYKAFGLLPIADLEKLSEGETVTLGGVITKRRTRKDRWDREYLVLTLEDFDSSVEIMAFADLLENYRPLLQVDNLVIVQGKVRLRTSRETQFQETGGVAQVWAERIGDFNTARSWVKKITIEIPAERLDDLLMVKIRDVLTKSPGQTPVFLKLTAYGSTLKRLWLKSLPVQIRDDLLSELDRIVEPEGGKITAPLPPPPPTRRPPNSDQKKVPVN